MSKRCEKFIFFTINNPALFKPGLQKLANGVITSSNEALLDRVKIQKVVAARKAKDGNKEESASGLAGLAGSLAGGLLTLGLAPLTVLHDMLPEHQHIPRAKGSDDAEIVGVNISFTNRGMTKVISYHFPLKYQTPNLTILFSLVEQ